MPRSTFVTVIAAFGILGGCFATFGGLMMLAMQPSLTAVSVLVGGVFGLVAAFALRRRRNWARLSFIGVQAYAILGSIVNVIRQPAQIAARLTSTGMSAEDARAAASASRTPMMVVALIFGVINILIIAKLCSRDVRAEFDALE